ncbi:hypothetical protein ACEZDB_12945 [Streptacidiphilus sp. N1-3]|uniref:Uncharacterized protein n=1 Tax=Streptacidiphilus alkalitolerans TaxID=3342712 RepID=A0ABV6WZY2_9ACTN
MKERAPEEPAAHTGTIPIRDREVVAALRPSNAGGICLARDTRTRRGPKPQVRSRSAPPRAGRTAPVGHRR